MRRKFDYLWFLIVSWLEEHEPKVCQRCGTIVFEKNTKNAHHVSGQLITLCKGCYQKLFRPFGEDPAGDD